MTTEDGAYDDDDRGHRGPPRLTIEATEDGAHDDRGPRGLPRMTTEAPEDCRV
ncbi:hypothetical protein [Streptomyces sp. NPDC047024]|uniref:hypothetical protein n=1 Tax=Streptomyces sp. NPDC047024 TaxID=3155476 RepID=UPI00340FB9E8